VRGGAVATGHLDCPGLPLEGLEPGRIFEPFYFRAAGMGRLALPLARRVLEAHGGSLGAAAAPGGGLRIVFTLPCL
jgi:signal transduction histidine kinase